MPVAFIENVPQGKPGPTICKKTVRELVTAGRSDGPACGDCNDGLILLHSVGRVADTIEDRLQSFERHEPVIKNRFELWYKSPNFVVVVDGLYEDW